MGVVRALFILLLVTTVVHKYWREGQLESLVSFQEIMFPVPSCGEDFLICLCLPLFPLLPPVGPDESQEFFSVPTDGLWHPRGGLSPVFHTYNGLNPFQTC